jgi:hypothetical protein
MPSMQSPTEKTRVASAVQHLLHPSCHGLRKGSAATVATSRAVKLCALGSRRTPEAADFYAMEIEGMPRSPFNHGSCKVRRLPSFRTSEGVQSKVSIP